MFYLKILHYCEFVYSASLLIYRKILRSNLEHHYTTTNFKYLKIISLQIKKINHIKK